MEWPLLKGSKVASAWQPMSAAMCTGPTSCCASFNALNTGRSGQPMQKPGGRGGSGRITSSMHGAVVRLVVQPGQAVRRGIENALLVVDMPFGSYEASPEQAFMNAARIMRETGCAAVKLEGGRVMAPTIEFLVNRH